MSTDGSPNSMVNILRRHVAELEVVRAQMLRQGENPDDSDELLAAIVEIRAVRRIIDDIVNDLPTTDDRE